MKVLITIILIVMQILSVELLCIVIADDSVHVGNTNGERFRGLDISSWWGRERWGERWLARQRRDRSWTLIRDGGCMRNWDAFFTDMWKQGMHHRVQNHPGMGGNFKE